MVAERLFQKSFNEAKFAPACAEMLRYLIFDCDLPVFEGRTMVSRRVLQLFEGLTSNAQMGSFEQDTSEVLWLLAECSIRNVVEPRLLLVYLSHLLDKVDHHRLSNMLAFMERCKEQLMGIPGLSSICKELEKACIPAFPDLLDQLTRPLNTFEIEPTLQLEEVPEEPEKKIWEFDGGDFMSFLLAQDLFNITKVKFNIPKQMPKRFQDAKHYYSIF